MGRPARLRLGTTTAASHGGRRSVLLICYPKMIEVKTPVEVSGVCMSKVSVFSMKIYWSRAGMDRSARLRSGTAIEVGDRDSGVAWWPQVTHCFFILIL